MIDNLTLLAGVDIPFPQGQIVIHPPTIKEIAYLGEENFFIGCNLLTFSKDKLLEKDKVNLEGLSNFEVLLSIVNHPGQELRGQQDAFIQLFTILFPNYQFRLLRDKIEFYQEDLVLGYLNKDNYDDFKKLVIEILCIGNVVETEEFTMKGELAKQIAEKLKERQIKLAKQKQERGEVEKVSIFSRYISILAVGEGKDMNALMQYTPYQLFDELNRFELKTGFDYYVQAKMAGATGLNDVDDWMKELHP